MIDFTINDQKVLNIILDEIKTIENSGRILRIHTAIDNGIIVGQRSNDGEIERRIHLRIFDLVNPKKSDNDYWRIILESNKKVLLHQMRGLSKHFWSYVKDLLNNAGVLIVSTKYSTYYCYSKASRPLFKVVITKDLEIEKALAKGSINNAIKAAEKRIKEANDTEAYLNSLTP